MRPHPRIRKTIKWGGLAVTVLLVVVWVGSGWWFFRIAWNQSYEVITAGGAVSIRLYPAHNTINSDFPGTLLKTNGFHFGLNEWYVSSSSTSPYVRFPFWMLLVPMAATTLVTWRLDTLARRRARLTPHLCPKCNYDRTGLASDAKCPECGSGGTPA